MRETIDCFGLTDVGKVRERNEDQFLIADLDKSMLVRQTSLATEDHTRLVGGPQGHLFLVADGIGGAAGGRRASGLTVQTLSRYVLTTMPWFFRLRTDEENDLSDELTTALAACQRAVAEAAASDPDYARMGTTVTLAYVLWPRLYVVHVGDSRAYLARDGKLHRITRDHTVAQQMVDQGTLSAAEAERSRWGRVLTRCVTGTEGFHPDVFKATLQAGDSLLLCSDGLTKYVSDGDIAKYLDDRPAEDATRKLVAAANEAGGDDNVTVIVARFPHGEKTSHSAVHKALTAMP